LIDDRKDPYRIRIPVIWDEIDDVKQRLMKLEVRQNVYEESWEVRTMSEFDSLMNAIREELKSHNVIFVTLEKHDK
jgi:hypothetical protein